MKIETDQSQSMMKEIESLQAQSKRLQEIFENSFPTIKIPQYSYVDVSLGIDDRLTKIIDLWKKQQKDIDILGCVSKFETIA